MSDTMTTPLTTFTTTELVNELTDRARGQLRTTIIYTAAAGDEEAAKCTAVGSKGDIIFALCHICAGIQIEREMIAAMRMLGDING